MLNFATNSLTIYSTLIRLKTDLRINIYILTVFINNLDITSNITDI